MKERIGGWGRGCRFFPFRVELLLIGDYTLVKQTSFEEKNLTNVSWFSDVCLMFLTVLHIFA